MEILDDVKGYTCDELGIETLETYCDELRMRLGIEVNQVQTVIQKQVFTDVLVKKNSPKRYHEQKDNVPTFNMENECFKLSFLQHDENTVELYWIETFEKCKGMGSDLMNTILDVADDLGIDIRTIPADFDGVKGKYDIFTLRKWYESFGFTNGFYKKAVYTYKAEK